MTARIVRLASAAAVAAGLGLAAGCVPLKEAPPPEQPPALQQHVVAFDYTGGQQQWVVPAGVAQAEFDARGAEGGGTVWSHFAGWGARAVATVPLTPGETVYVYVGGAGVTADNAGVCSSLPGGFNGGGAGGRGIGVGRGGSGGGATDIRRGGFTLAHRVLVAGGGGGSGFGNLSLGQGGAGGDPAGELGEDGTNDAFVTGGGGGGQAFGGAGGLGGGGDAIGALGGTGGGEGAGCPGGPFYSGGGGGGGYFGGGGGGADADPDPGAVNAAGGGGGSSFGPVGTEYPYCACDDHGEVTITYLA